MLVVDPGMHTAPITAVAVDAEGRFAVTSSYDKTLRVWSLSNGESLRTIRMPAGPGNTGKLYAVAISPDGGLIAAAGWTLGGSEFPIYLFDRDTGRMSGEIAGLPTVTHRLTFSADGRYLAAGLGSPRGVRVYDRDQGWAEVLRTVDYGGDTYGAAFARDGRLATASYDGNVRLYNQAFELIATKKGTLASRPRGLAFSPNGAKLAIGYNDLPAVEILDGHTLETLASSSDSGLRGGDLSEVAWPTGGQTIVAGGRFWESGHHPLVAWNDAGRGERRTIGVGRGTIRSLAATPDGGILVATMVPELSLLGSDGKVRWHRPMITAKFAGQAKDFAVSAAGTIVDFGLEKDGTTRLRFDLRVLGLINDPPRDSVTEPPRQGGLPIEDWESSYGPTLDGKRIALDYLDISRSLAIHPDGTRFMLGSSWSLQALDAKGVRIWHRAVPGEAWAVNITGDGRIAVAAYDDGTIRWHRMDDGRELLAFMVLADGRNWAAWTPEGFYAATPGAHGVLRWHVNRGPDAAAETVPVSQIPRLRRPDALALVLQELETARALGIADMAAARYDVQVATGAATAPGARLHLLTVGVSDYGERAKHLRLEFAHKDAIDVASALVNTQGAGPHKIGGLYAEVSLQNLTDKFADKVGIFKALDAVQRKMEQGSNGYDFAVVMFSGHGAVVDGQFYLLPHGVDTRTSADIEATAILVSQLRAKLSKLGEHGRVLLLLDACRSGAATADGVLRAPNAGLLQAALLSINNVTVLTSSKADKLSREDVKWQNGAFTKVLLEAFGRAADADNNGVISMSELITYLAAHLPILTGGDQHPSMEQRFQSDIFVAGL